MPISLAARWFIRPGQEKEAYQALSELAANVQAKEPGTLAYLLHTPSADARLQSLPPPEASVVTFFETYASVEAYLDHLNGPIFTNFVTQHGYYFVSSHGKPFTTVQFLEPFAGFVGRGHAAPLSDDGKTNNLHPAVMFEIIAKDSAKAQAFYQQVFGWQYQMGTGGFAYVHFPKGAPPLLGGIGQAQSGNLGMEPGRNFYLLVDTLEPVLDAVVAAGGSVLLPPTSIDGYRFAMFYDLEGNSIGLIEPFCD